jgi:hypothetical protein
MAARFGSLMRATTEAIPYVSRAMRAATMFELSPEVTAATAPASAMSACSSTDWLMTLPSTARPVNRSGSRRNDSFSRSTMATEWPSASRVVASRDPIRPQPRTMMCIGPQS